MIKILLILLLFCSVSLGQNEEELCSLNEHIKETEKEIKEIYEEVTEELLWIEIKEEL